MKGRGKSNILSLKWALGKKTNETENEPGVSSVPSTGNEAHRGSSHIKENTEAMFFVYNKEKGGRTGSSTTVDSGKRESQVQDDFILKNK